MPLFEFLCGHCRERNEILVRGNEKPVCPDCGSADLRKQPGVFAAKMGKTGEPAACAEPNSCCRCANGSCSYLR